MLYLKVAKRVLHCSSTGGRAEQRENSGTQLIDLENHELGPGRAVERFRTTATVHTSLRLYRYRQRPPAVYRYR